METQKKLIVRAHLIADGLQTYNLQVRLSTMSVDNGI